MSADCCGYCGTRLIYLDGDYICPKCTITKEEQFFIRQFGLNPLEVPRDKLPAEFVKLINSAEAAEARAERLQAALQGLMQFHPEDELGPQTEEYWTPEYKAAMDAARDALKGGGE